MDLAELTLSRRTVHNYKKAKVDDTVVERALELSLWAPNHKLTFPWQYFWIGDAARKKLADLSVELKNAKEPLNDVKKKAVIEKVTNPSHVILLGTRRSPDAVRAHEDFASLACAVQIASLYLWEKHIGSKWTTGGFSSHARAYEILGISPDDVLLEGALLVGIPLIVPAATKRPPLERFMRRVE